MFDLSREEIEIRDLTRQLAEDIVAPEARESDEERRFNRALLEKLGQAGLVGGPIQKKYGGLELGQRAQVFIYEELGKVDSSVRGLPRGADWVGGFLHSAVG